MNVYHRKLYALLYASPTQELNDIAQQVLQEHLPALHDWWQSELGQQSQESS